MSWTAFSTVSLRRSALEHCVKKKEEKVGYVQPRVARGRGGAARAAEPSPPVACLSGGCGGRGLSGGLGLGSGLSRPRVVCRMRGRLKARVKRAVKATRGRRELGHN